MKSSYLTAGITLSRLSKLLAGKKISFHPKYLCRIIFLYQSAFWSSFFAFFERKRYNARIDSSPLPPSPVFIIGHWRTGSTFLHKLLSLDPQIAVPTLFDVAEPDSLLTSYIYYKPVMKLMISKYRPMDKVLLGMNEPQEDEYAIYRITEYSPLEHLIFPESGEYFLKGKSSFIPEGQKKELWKQQMAFFYRKLFYKYKKIIVSKNPFNSMRIREILEIFPDARFIHIHRHPYEVIPSTINMWNIVQRQNVLNRNADKPQVKDVSEVMRLMLERIEVDKNLIPDGNFAEIAYEKFEKDPVQLLEKLYNDLGLVFSDEFRRKLISYLGSSGNFDKNKFSLTSDEKLIISSILEKHMSQYGYKP